VWHSNGQKYKETDTIKGERLYWYDNGNIKSSGDFEYNKPTGLHSLWFDNGTKRAEINYKDGRRDGEFTFWHNNGQIKFQGNYLSGQVIGIWTVWHSNGQKYKETDTIKGERLYWYDNGQIESRQCRACFENDESFIRYTKFESIRNWDLEGNPINGEIFEIKDQFEYWNIGINMF
jgi:antitoxin component YwqK of YwqJK toxin-antitoxin module